MGRTKEINSFEGEYKFLSNFYLWPMVWDGLHYPALENAFQAQKTEDKEQRLIFQHITPAKAKQKGRQLELRADWEDVKLTIMGNLLTAKFKDPVLAEALRKTGQYRLVEGNWWGDTYWGRCNGIGENWLGVLLMRVRDHHL